LKDLDLHKNTSIKIYQSNQFIAVLRLNILVLFHETVILANSHPRTDSFTADRCENSVSTGQVHA